MAGQRALTTGKVGDHRAGDWLSVETGYEAARVTALQSRPPSKPTVDLGTPPAGSTAVYISFTCLTAGDFTFADGAGVECDRADAGAQSRPATYTMSIAPGQHSTIIIATPGARWRLVATYALVTTTARQPQRSDLRHPEPARHPGGRPPRQAGGSSSSLVHGRALDRVAQSEGADALIAIGDTGPGAVRRSVTVRY